MDWPEVAAEIARATAPKLHEGVINGAVVVIVMTGAGAILMKIRRAFDPSGGTGDLQRQLDSLAKKVEALDGKLDVTDTRVAEIHGMLRVMVTVQHEPRVNGQHRCAAGDMGGRDARLAPAPPLLRHAAGAIRERAMRER